MIPAPYTVRPEFRVPNARSEARELRYALLTGIHRHRWQPPILPLERDLARMDRAMARLGRALERVFPGQSFPWEG